METRVALIGIIVENSESTAQLNALLHDAGQYIIGRMGLPYRAKGVMASTSGKKLPQPSKIGSFAARWITQEAVSAMSEVRYRLSVRG